MPNMTSCDLFASRGDEWNRPNYQFHVDDYYRRRHPDGTLEVVGRRLIDGYDAVPETARPKRAEPRPRFVDPPRPEPKTDARLMAIRLMRSKKAVRSAVFAAARKSKG